MKKISAYAGLDDRALVQKCVEGDRLAWDTLINRYSKLIYSIAVKFRFDASEREDVVQNVGVKLLKGLPSLRDPEKVYSWLIKTTHRECLALVEQRQRELAPEREGPPLDPVPTQEEMFMLCEKHEILRKVLATWDNPCGLLIRMLYFEDRSFKETADCLGVSPEGISASRGRCLERLRRSLATHGIKGL